MNTSSLLTTPWRFSVPPQIYTTPRWTSEQLLMAAALEDAITSIQSFPRNRTARQEQAQDWAWVLSEDTMWPFSFVNICEALGLNAEWVRAGLREGRGAA